MQDSSPFLRSYEAFLSQWADDYDEVDHQRGDLEARIERFYGTPPRSWSSNTSSTWTCRG